MAGDRSLDEFLSPGSDGESDVEADNTEPEPDGPAPETPDAEHEEAIEEEAPAEFEASGEAASDVEPIDTSYAWSPDGGECTTCGETVDVRWRDDGELVCVDCKDW